MALVVLSVVEQRLDAVREVLAGADVIEVAARYGVHRSTVHRWVGRYLVGQLAGLADRSHRPKGCPHQVPAEVEAAVAEMRRKHPRWGSRRIRLEMLRRPVEGVVVPSERTIDRALIRQGLLRSRPRKKPRSAYIRFERPGPMQLWGIDIVGGIELVDTVTGEVREAKLVTGVDDHSRYCVMAQVVERATGRAVCLAFAQALARFGVPEEVITDNGKQFTDRFGKGGEVLFDKICRRNGIRHRLTAPSSPNQNGKVERFHGTFRPDFLDTCEPFESLEAAQAAVDAWVAGYNTDRPHQALDVKVPVTPAERFAPVPGEQQALLPLWLPATLHPIPSEKSTDTEPVLAAAPAPVPGGPVELERVVGASGNLAIRGQQFWLGPARAGQRVRFWVDCDLVHLMIGGTRVKTVRSHLSVTDLAALLAEGGVPAGPSPLPATAGVAAGVVEVERAVARSGTVSLGGHVILAAEILAGRQVGIRLEEHTLMFFDLDTRELLRTRPNPIPREQWLRLRAVRPAGPPLRPSREPVTVQRRASNSGIVMVCGQKIALGRTHAHQTVTIHVAETTLAIEVDDETRIVARTTTTAVRNIKVDRPRTVPSVS